MTWWKSKPKVWRTVAIDTRHSWIYARDKDKDNPPSEDHILRYEICDETGERRMSYDDPSDHGREYAENGSDAVAKVRSKWIHAGVIVPPSKKNRAKVTYVDPTYAPLGDFEKYWRMIKGDAALESVLKEKMVDDALGQLEVAIKLHLKNGTTGDDEDDD